MLQLLWSALNVALLIYFIVLCFRATKLIRENSGLFASILFGLGLLSFMAQSGKDKNAENQVVKQGLASQDKADPASITSLTITLEKSFGNSLDLRIHYGKDSTGKNVPLEAFSNRNGFVSGLEWVPRRILVRSTTEGDDFNYTVDGMIQWKLLGVTVYNQEKRYEKAE